MSFSKSKYWLLIVDDATDYCWSFFLKSKDKTFKTMIGLVKDLTDIEKKSVKYIWCDNSGENLTFQCDAKEARLGLTFEFTAHKMPQQNGCIEQKFAMLYGRVRAMLNKAHFVDKYEYLQHGLWAECATTATKLKNIIVKGNMAPAFNAFFNKEAPYKESLWTFGEVAIVPDAKTLRSKLENRGVPCLFVGYMDNHPRDTFCMFNMETKHVWCT